MEKSESQSSKLDRKTAEKNRRIHMKGLCSRLSSLVPPHFIHHQERRSQQDQLDQAAAYITHMKQRLEELKNKKEALNGENCINNSNNEDEAASFAAVDVKDFGSDIQISVISGLNNNFMLSQAIKIIEEEGAHVETATFKTAGQKIFYFIHAQAKISRVGVETSRVCQRLQELVNTSST